MLWVHLVFFLPSLGINNCSKELWFFYEEQNLETKIWVLSVFTATRVSLLLDPISRIRNYVFICTHTHSCICFSHSVRILSTMNSLWYFQFQSQTTGFILALLLPIILSVFIRSVNLVCNQTPSLLALIKGKWGKEKKQKGQHGPRHASPNFLVYQTKGDTSLP